MARSELANAARVARRNPDDPVAASRVDQLRSEYHATKMARQINSALPNVGDVDVWAERAADGLVGAAPVAARRLAAALAARLSGVAA